MLGLLECSLEISKCCLVVTVKLVVGRGAARGRNRVVHASRLEAEMAGEEQVED